jgi:hypothetical protein
VIAVAFDYLLGLDVCEARDEIDNPTETYTDWAA